jgi:formylmethanofuran dehydrogenase subunit D
MPKKNVKNHLKLTVESKYQGKYVAFSSSEGKKVIASGRDAGIVIEKARKKGVDTPAIVFVPKEDVTYIY